MGKDIYTRKLLKKSCWVKVKIKIVIDLRSSRSSALWSFIPSLGINFVVVLLGFNQTSLVLKHTREPSPLVFR